MLVSFPAWEPHGMPGDNFVDYISCFPSDGQAVAIRLSKQINGVSKKAKQSLKVLNSLNALSGQRLVAEMDVLNPTSDLYVSVQEEVFAFSLLVL